MQTLYKSLLSIVCASMLILSSCLTLGTDFSTDMDWIEINKTTQSQLSMRLGVPEEVGVSSGEKMWTYYYIQHFPFVKTQRKELRIYWNANLTVKAYNFTTTFDHDATASPNKSSHAPSK